MTHRAVLEEVVTMPEPPHGEQPPSATAGPRDRKTPRGTVALTLGGGLLTCAAAFATYFALAVRYLCENDCGTFEQRWQLYAAVAGLVATVAMTGCVATGRRLAATRLLVIAVVLYAAWAVLLDADTHGWGNGPVPF
jgi:hypothetical protein